MCFYSFSIERSIPVSLTDIDLPLLLDSYFYILLFIIFFQALLLKIDVLMTSVNTYRLTAQDDIDLLHNQPIRYTPFLLKWLIKTVRNKENDEEDSLHYISQNKELLHF